MLYLTTRNPADSFTSHRALYDECTGESGLLIPMHMPSVMDEEGDATFSQMVAKVLNLFFDKQLGGWDIEFAIGRSSVKYAPLNHRIIVAKLWYNREQRYKRFERAIYEKLTGSNSGNQRIPQWPRIAIRMAVLFGIAADLAKDGITSFDIAAPANDLELVVAVWYAKRMGLPVGMVICGDTASSNFWDLFRNGEIRAFQGEADSTQGLERVVFDLFGKEACKRFVSCDQKCEAFKITDEQRKHFNSTFFVSVLSKERIEGLIKNVYRSCDFFLDPSTAVSYGALQDYRARNGEGRMTLILADETPANSAEIVRNATGLSALELKNKLNA